MWQQTSHNHNQMEEVPGQEQKWDNQKKYFRVSPSHNKDWQILSDGVIMSFPATDKSWQSFQLI